MKQLVLFIFIMLCRPLISQKTLEYGVFMTAIQNNHPLIKRAQNYSQLGESALRAARGNYDPSLTGAYSNKFYDQKNYYSVLNAELKQAIFTNQSIKAGYELGQGSNIDPETATSSYGLAYLGIEASLLQGLVIDKRRAEVLKAEQYRAMNESERKQLTNAILLQNAQMYTDWLLTQNLVRITNYFAQLAAQRLDGIKALAAIGERPAIDTTEASMLVQQRLLDFQAALVENQKQLAMVSINYWPNDRPEQFDLNLRSRDSLVGLLSAVIPKLNNELLDYGHTNPVVAQYQSQLKFLEIEKRYRAELVKPVLNVNYNFLITPGPDNFDALLSLNNYKWGASLSFPLFLRNSRAELNMAKLNMKNMNYELQMKENEIDAKIRAISSSIKVLAEQVKTAEKAVTYSKLMLEGEKLKFENGESSVFLINTRETKWLESEIKLNEYIDKYIKSVFELIYLKGNLNYTLN